MTNKGSDPESIFHYAIEKPNPGQCLFEEQRPVAVWPFNWIIKRWSRHKLVLRKADRMIADSPRILFTVCSSNWFVFSIYASLMILHAQPMVVHSTLGYFSGRADLLNWLIKMESYSLRLKLFWWFVRGKFIALFCNLVKLQ